jgi:hypothetical protein
MANLAWAKNAVLVAADHELEFEQREQAANDPSKCTVKRGSALQKSAPMRQNAEGGL